MSDEALQSELTIARKVADKWEEYGAQKEARIEALEAENAKLRAERDEAYERAAQKAEHYDFGPERDERDNARNSISRIIAAAIRQLKGQHND